MKFLTIASTFAAFAVASISAAPHKSNLRKLQAEGSFLESKPEDPGCHRDGYLDCQCRDGSYCYTTQQCVNLGNSGSCAVRDQTSNKSARLTCRNGDVCTPSTGCDDRTACKERNSDDDDSEDGSSFLSFDRALDVDVEAKPAAEDCMDGTRRCTCRDGSTCKTTAQCKNRTGYSGGSCAYRPPSRNTKKSCRNGKSCTNNNTACADGSKCKVRNGFLASA